MTDAAITKMRSALVPTAPSAAWRSHSAPPRKKWYRRAAGPLLNRQRSTTQQPGTMLYDQMVARRLVSAIAAWHDLHASLLQLSLHAADDDADGADERRRGPKRKGDGSRVSSRASSICSVAAGHGRKATASGRRKASRTASGRRKCQRQTSARRSGRNQLCVDESRGPSPRSSFSAGSARSSPVGAGVGGGSSRHFTPRSPSRSSSVASGDSSSDAERHRRRGVLAAAQGGPSTSSLWCSPGHHLPSSQDALLRFSKSSSSVVAAEEQPTAATWSAATFAQSLQIRASTARDTRDSRRTARSASTRGGEIVLNHSVKLLDPAGGSSSVPPHCANCLLSASAQPTLLSPPPFDHHFRQRRCFSVAKVGIDEPAARRQRCCSCGGEEEENETDSNEGAEDGGEAAEGEEAAAEADDTASSDGGAISDTELDALVAEEKNRPKFSLTEPELSPEQLRQLFPELSDHWRFSYLDKLKILKNEILFFSLYIFSCLNCSMSLFFNASVCLSLFFSRSHYLSTHSHHSPSLIFSCSFSLCCSMYYFPRCFLHLNFFYVHNIDP